jgi:hypothetical protein
MPWTKQQYIDNWPDGPNPYSRSDEPRPNGQLVDESAMLRAMDAHELRMQKCICGYDGDARDDGTPYAYRIAKPGCPVHSEEDEE